MLNLAVMAEAVETLVAPDAGDCVVTVGGELSIVMLTPPDVLVLPARSVATAVSV